MDARKSLSRILVCGLAVVFGALWCAAPPAARATGGDFDYAVERVTADGNVNGPFDGTPDYVEEFDGSTSMYQRFFGTVEQVGGALHLMSPGTPLDIPELGLSLNQSDVVSTRTFLRDGAGDARVEVAFRAATLGVNHFVHATLNVQNPGQPGAYVGLAFSNYDEVVAGHIIGPSLPGFSMFGHLVTGSLGGFVPTAGNSIPVDPASVGGAFVLALDYDDTRKTITPTYSLDGGQTFNGGLDTLDVPPFDGTGTGVAGLIIGADPRDLLSGPPPPVCPFGLSSTKVTVMRRQNGTGRVSLHMRGSFDSNSSFVDPVNEGLQLTVSDHGSLGVLANLSGGSSIPPSGAGGGCDPRDGWATVGSRMTYRNRSNALPPACTPGSAQGLTRLVVKRKTSPWDVEVTAAMTGPAVSVSGPLYALLIRGRSGTGDGTGTCLAVQSGDTACTARGTRVTCQNY